MLAVADRVTSGVQQAMVAWLAPAPGSRVLEVGCGSGGFAVRLALRVGHSGRLVAVDTDAEAVAKTRAALDEHGYVGGDLQVADIREFTDEPFDLVVARSTVHHLPDQAETIRALARLAVPGGHVAVGEGGFPLRCLPFDLGVGEPGLEARLEVARDRWFEQMRRGLEGSQAAAETWPSLLRGAGLRGVVSRTFLLDVPAPVPADARAFAREHLAFMRDEERAPFVEPADLALLDRLLDPDDAIGVDRREDLYLLAGYSLHAARR